MVLLNKVMDYIVKINTDILDIILHTTLIV